MALYHDIGKLTGLHQTDKAVLQELARRADKRGRAVVGRDKLAEYACTSPRSVTRSVSSLILQGWLTVERRTLKDGRKAISVYTITDPARLLRIFKASQDLPLMDLIKNHRDITPDKQSESKTEPATVHKFRPRAKRFV